MYVPHVTTFMPTHVLPLHGLDVQHLCTLHPLPSHAVPCWHTLLQVAYFIAAVSPNMEIANTALPAYIVTLLFFIGFLPRFSAIHWYWRWCATAFRVILGSCSDSLRSSSSSASCSLTCGASSNPPSSGFGHAFI